MNRGREPAPARGRRACAAAAALAGLLGVCACQGTPSASGGSIHAPARTVPVARGSLRDRVLLTGELEAVTSDALRVPRTSIWQLSIRWMADDGSRVTAGDRLLEFDNSAFTGKLEEKKLRLRQARLDLSAAQAAARIDLADKRFEVEKQKVLLDKAALLAGVPKDLLSLREWQTRKLALARARTAWQEAKAQRASAVKSTALDLHVKLIETDKLAREVQTAEQGIAALTLRAPRDGIVVVEDHPWQGRKIQVGDVVQPGWTVLEIPDLSAMKVKANLSDVDDGRIKPGMRATCTLDAYPGQPLAGVVRSVSPVATAMSRKSLRRAFRVDIALDHTDPARMRPGMSVKVEIVAHQSDGAILAPRAGLDLSGTAPQAVLAGGRHVPVTLGPCDAHACVVERGLRPGQRLEVIEP